MADELKTPYVAILTPTQAAWGLLLAGSVDELTRACMAVVHVVERLGDSETILDWIDRQNGTQSAFTVINNG